MKDVSEDDNFHPEKRGGNIFRCKDWEEFNLNKSREKWEFSLSLSFKSFGRDLLAGGGGNPPLISIMNDAWERIENIIIITRNPFPVFQFKKRKACRLCLQTPTNKNTAQQKKRLDGKQSWKGREKNGKLNSGETSRRTDGYPWWVESPAFVLLLLAEKKIHHRERSKTAPVNVDKTTNATRCKHRSCCCCRHQQHIRVLCVHLLSLSLCARVSWTMKMKEADRRLYFITDAHDSYKNFFF